MLYRLHLKLSTETDHEILIRKGWLGPDDELVSREFAVQLALDEALLAVEQLDDRRTTVIEAFLERESCARESQ